MKMTAWKLKKLQEKLPADINLDDVLIDNIEKYSGEKYVDHLLLALEQPLLLHFFIRQIQHLNELSNPLDALKIFLNKVAEYDPGLMQELNQDDFMQKLIFARITENINLYNDDNKLIEFYKNLLEILPANKSSFTHNPPTPFEIVNDQHQKNPQDIKIFLDNFVEIHRADASIVNSLQAWFPEKSEEIQNKKDSTEEDLFKQFTSGIATSVRNRSTQDFPFVTLNKDNSISFQIYKFEPNESCGRCKDTCHCKERCDKFEEALTSSGLVDSLQGLMVKNNIVNELKSDSLLEVNDMQAATGIVEYKLNLTPENLDSILKQNINYFYRDEGSILKLNKSFEMKPGVIRLAPIQTIDENTHLLRVAGCQTIELPSVQIMHLLPGFDGKEGQFHWVPKIVQEQLNLSSGDFSEILRKIYDSQGMLTTPRFYAQESGGDIILNSPKQTNSLRLVEIDANSKEFYSLYGNNSLEELNSCKSIEIGVEDFLKVCKDVLQEKSERVNDPELTQKIDKSLQLLNTMITNERKKQNQPSSAKGGMFKSNSTPKISEENLNTNKNRPSM